MRPPDEPGHRRAEYRGRQRFVSQCGGERNHRCGSERRDRLQRKAGNLFSDNLLKLGPLYIKLGQIMSCRDNLLPKQWEKAMERLQDQVPSQKGEKAQQLAYLAWPGGKESFDDTFVDVDWTPLAAARSQAADADHD